MWCVIFKNLFLRVDKRNCSVFWIRFTELFSSNRMDIVVRVTRHTKSLIKFLCEWMKQKERNEQINCKRLKCTSAPGFFLSFFNVTHTSARATNNNSLIFIQLAMCTISHIWCLWNILEAKRTNKLDVYA